jgi:hypothetical protein
VALRRVKALGLRHGVTNEELRRVASYERWC